MLILFWIVSLAPAGLRGPAWAAAAGETGGVKVRVAVAKFGANDSFTQRYGGWDVGGGLSAQLVTELINSGQVIVVERGILSQIIREQELANSKLVTKETAAQVGKLLGVDYLIVGEVTEFEQKAVGAGGHFGLFDWFFPKVSGDFTAAHVGIDLRVIDTTTGEILHSHRASGRAWDKAGAVELNSPISFTFGADAFHKTPLGKATRKVINDALGFILGSIQERLESYSNWVGKVIHVEGQLIYINAGSISQVNVGDRLSVFSIKKVLTDPETNQVVGLIESPIGELGVVSTKEKFSMARVVEGRVLPKKGDVVRFAKPSAIPGASGARPGAKGLEQLSYQDADYLVLE